MKTGAPPFLSFQTAPIRKTHQEAGDSLFVVEEFFMPAVKRNSEMVFPNLFDLYFESFPRPRKYADVIVCYLVPGARTFLQLFDDLVEHTGFDSFYPRTSRHFREMQRNSHRIAFVTFIVSPGLQDECLLEKFVNEREERGKGLKVKDMILALPRKQLCIDPSRAARCRQRSLNTVVASWLLRCEDVGRRGG
jgi:hypothetical protein